MQLNGYRWQRMKHGLDAGPIQMGTHIGQTVAYSTTTTVNNGGVVMAFYSDSGKQHTNEQHQHHRHREHGPRPGRPGARRRQRRRDHRPRPGQGQGVGRRARRRHGRDVRHRPGRGHRHPRRAVRQRGGGGRPVRGRPARQGHRRHHQPHHPRFHGLVTPEGSSGAQEIAKAAPAGAHVVKAFNTRPRRRSGGQARRGPPAGRVHRRRRRAGQGDACRRSSRAWDCARWTPGRCPWRGHWRTPACCMLGLVTHSVKHTNFSLGVSILS